MEDPLQLFQSIGLSEAKAKDTVQNGVVSNSLKTLILEVICDGFLVKMCARSINSKCKQV